MSDSIEKFGYEQKLKRTLPFRDVLIYGMIFMVPIAPMGIYGIVAQQAYGMVPFVYFVGICAMIFTALSYYRMSQEFPISGSVYAYVQRGINPHVGFIAGWTIMLDYIMTPALLYAMTGVWVASLIPAGNILHSPWIWVVFFILVNTIINVLGIEFTAKANMIMLAIELIALVIFVVLGLVFVFGGGGAGGLSTAPLFQPDKMNLSFIAMATSIAVLSFLGFDAISTLAEEATDAQKIIGKATVTALILLGAIFMLQTYVAALVAPDTSKLDPNTAFFQIAGIAGGHWMEVFLTVVNIIAVGIANTLAAQAGISRILFSMARDKVIPGFFSAVHPKYKTPYVSTIFVACLSILVVILTQLKIDLLVKLVNFGALTSFIMLNFTVFWYFFVKQGKRDGKGVLYYLIFPLIGVLIIGYVWWGFDSLTKIFGFCWLAIGIVYGAIVSKGYKKVPDVFNNVKL